MYGLIVSGSVLATSRGASATAIAVEVLVTLLVYWSVERYACLTAERIHAGQPLPPRVVVGRLAAAWALVGTSLVPLLVLVCLRLGGVELGRAVQAALATTAVLLGRCGWRIGRHRRLGPRGRSVSAVVSGLLGVVLVALKAGLH